MMSLFLVVCLLVAVKEGSSQPNNNAQLLSTAVVDFSQDLYQQIAVNKDSVIYSPLSIHLALTMTWLGAGGDTATEMATALGVNTFPDNSSPHQAYKNLITQINNETTVLINTANAIFVNPSEKLESQFITDVADYYQAKAENYDPAAPGGPEKQINDFVEENTNNQITNLLPPDTINDDTLAIIVNALLFNGTWKYPFFEQNTKDRNFFTRNKTIQLPTLYDERIINIKRKIYKADVAQIKFSGGKFSFYIALPRTVDGIKHLENSLVVPGAVNNLFTNLVATHVKLSFPKFNLENSFNLKSPLQELGIKKAFIPGVANFQEISNSSNVHVSGVAHKAKIEVTEKGIIAAAATAIFVSTTSVQLPPNKVFKADHPFIYFIRNDNDGMIYFQGKFGG